MTSSIADAENNGVSKFRLIVMGPGAVGKSSLTIRYLFDNFIDEYDPTIEEYYLKQIELDEKPVLLEIMDTAGQEEFQAMQDEYYRSGEGFLLVYSITSDISFKDVQQTYNRIIRSRETNDRIAIVLAGNKCDLHPLREVPTQTGQDLANKWGCPFFETSAKTKVNNLLVFEEVVRFHFELKNPEPSDSGNNKPNQKGKKGKKKKDNKDGGGCCIL
jgi:GTPase KRas protein